MRYNLIEEKVMGPTCATLVSIVLPWVISIVLYCGQGFQNIVQFGGAFTSSIVNLLVPCLLFISCQQIDSGDLKVEVEVQMSCLENSPSSDQLPAAAAAAAPEAAPSHRQGQAQSFQAGLSTQASLTTAHPASLTTQPSSSGGNHLQTGSLASARNVHDMSGHINDESRRVMWLRLAWANLIVMSAVTVAVMYDQGIN
eukprot:TRINITY_DN283_c1_g1_i1.p1 TRINITY_DN283_c1_g1~~TRINITY_DN283_c1_g1_i1.p1  ORF type:complete len:198 (-),score=18.44 TRINITY_DN283_c1_g1_i1:229-822(-)